MAKWRSAKALSGEVESSSGVSAKSGSNDRHRFWEADISLHRSRIVYPKAVGTTLDIFVFFGNKRDGNREQSNNRSEVWCRGQLPDQPTI